MCVENDIGEEGIKLRSKYMKLGVLLGLLLTFWLLEVAIASAAPLSCHTTRVYRDTRTETAIHISQMGWQQAGTVLLARADNLPDSLVPVPLSDRLDAPMLLTYPVIVVDPGHSGKDTGAIGATGTSEKNNTLPVGWDLADLLRSAEANVVLTRSTDALPTGVNYTELSDPKARVAMVTKSKANIFVSIHNDSFRNPAAYGTTTYYGTDNPQSDKSYSLALAMQKETLSTLAHYNRGSSENRGAKEAPF